MSLGLADVAEKNLFGELPLCESLGRAKSLLKLVVANDLAALLLLVYAGEPLAGAVSVEEVVGGNVVSAMVFAQEVRILILGEVRLAFEFLFGLQGGASAR